MKKWEYKTIIVDSKFKRANTINIINHECNCLGIEGWELVNFNCGTLDDAFVMIFKRPVEEGK